MKDTEWGLWKNLVVGGAWLYRHLPVKPFSGALGKLFAWYINSGNDRSLVRKKIEGINYELDLREVIDYAMYTSGSREPDTSRALKSLCKRGDVVLDIGANVGSHALPMASFVGEEGRVFAFEPVPWAMNRMKKNLGLNNFNNIVLEQIALSDTNEEVEMQFRASFKLGSKSGVGAEGKVDETWWGECERVQVRLETLDSYVSTRHFNHIDLIKLDVDGFEGKVVRGALETLKSFSPIIIMEVAPAWTEMRGDDMKDVLYLLEQLGYRFYRESDLELIKDMAKSIDSLPPGGGFNIVASVRDLV